MLNQIILIPAQGANRSGRRYEVTDCRKHWPFLAVTGTITECFHFENVQFLLCVVDAYVSVELSKATAQPHYFSRCTVTWLLTCWVIICREVVMEVTHSLLCVIPLTDRRRRSRHSSWPWPLFTSRLSWWCLNTATSWNHPHPPQPPHLLGLHEPAVGTALVSGGFATNTQLLRGVFWWKLCYKHPVTEGGSLGGSFATNTQLLVEGVFFWWKLCCKHPVTGGGGVLLVEALLLTPSYLWKGCCLVCQ